MSFITQSVQSLANGVVTSLGNTTLGKQMKSWSKTTWMVVGAGATIFAIMLYLDEEPKPQMGMFGGRAIPCSDKPIPMSQWPKSKDGRPIFVATPDWQDVPEGCVLPPGLHIEADMTTGRQRARLHPKR